MCCPVRKLHGYTLIRPLATFSRGEKGCGFSFSLWEKVPVRADEGETVPPAKTKPDITGGNREAERKGTNAF